MEKLVVYLFFLIAFFVLLKKKWEFVYLIPIFNILSDISFNYFEGFSAPTIMRAFILFLFIFYFRSSVGRLGSFKPLIFFLLYTVLMLFFTTELLYSFKSVMQVFLSMSMLLVGYVYFNDYERLKKLIHGLFWIILAGVIATGLGYLFGIGKVLEYTTNVEYEGGPEAVGLLGSGGLYGPAIALGLFTFILKYRLYPYKTWIFISLSIVLFIFILLNVRRTAISIPVIGYFSYLLLSKSKIRNIKFLFVGILLLILTFPLYNVLLEKRLDVRIEGGRFEKDFYTTEDRYSENVNIIKSITEFKEPLKILFGIGNNIFAENIISGNVSGRMYHTDSAKIFYGEGLLGLLLYFSLYIQLLIKIIRVPKTGILSEIRAGAFALWTISLFVSFNGSINLITFRSINFLLLGAFIGFAYSTIRNNGSISSS